MIRLAALLLSGILAGLLMASGPGISEAPPAHFGPPGDAGYELGWSNILVAGYLAVAVGAWRWRWMGPVHLLVVCAAVAWSVAAASQHPFWIGGARIRDAPPTFGTELVALAVLASLAFAFGSGEAERLYTQMRREGEDAAVARRHAARALGLWLAGLAFALALAVTVLLAAPNLVVAPATGQGWKRVLWLLGPLVLMAVGGLLAGLPPAPPRTTGDAGPQPDAGPRPEGPEPVDGPQP